MNRKTLVLWLDRLVAMTVKELKQLSRDPTLLIVIVYFFTIHIYVSASGVNMDLRRASLAVLDHDHSTFSRELIYKFRPPYFNLIGEISSDKQALELLDGGDVLAVLDIPEGFQEDLIRGRSTSVQMQVDASNSILGTLATTYAEEIVLRFNREHVERRLGLTDMDLQSVPVVVDKRRTYYNPNHTHSWFLTISELLTVITMLSLMLPAAVAVREKERGTIEQLIISPLTSTQILLPKIISMGLVILGGTAVSLFLIAVPFFHLPIKGSVPLFFAVTSFYVFATSGLGLFISTLSRNLSQVVMFVILLMMPLILLSGAWTPPEAMPPALRRAMYLSPLYYYIETAYAILMKGAGLNILWDSILGLVLWGSFVFVFGVWRFHRQFE